MIVERSEVKRSEAIFFGNVNKAWIFVDDFLHSIFIALQARQVKRVETSDVSDGNIETTAL